MKLIQFIDILIPFDKGISAISTVSNAAGLEEIFKGRSFTDFGMTFPTRQLKTDLLERVACSGDARSPLGYLIKRAHHRHIRSGTSVIKLHPFPLSYGIVPSWIPSLPYTNQIDDADCGIVPFLRQHTVLGQNLSVMNLAIRGMTLRRGNFALRNIRRRLLFILLVLNFAQRFSRSEASAIFTDMDSENVSWTLLYFFIEKYYPNDLKLVQDTFLEEYAIIHQRDCSVKEMDERLTTALPYYMVIVFKALFNGSHDRMLNGNRMHYEIHRAVFEVANDMTNRFSDGIAMFSKPAGDIIEEVHNKHSDMFDDMFLTNISLLDLYQIGEDIINRSKDN